MQELERLAVTCRDTAQSMEKASAEFETTSKVSLAKCFET